MFVLALACAACACGPGRHGGTNAEHGTAAEAAVVGTCLDAESGEKLSGVRVEGPDGKSAVSGRDGRFEIRGLKSGQAGELVASLSDGRRASLTLRPLAAGTLEVVLQLAPAR
jgi:hypothetical protein